MLVDPGHNGGNFAAPSVISPLIWNGRESETCDTTGAETDGGYTEAQFNWRVARYLTADLRAAGATVVLTRTSNNQGVGPCVNVRAAIINPLPGPSTRQCQCARTRGTARRARVRCARTGGVPPGTTTRSTARSAVLGAAVRDAFAAGTAMPVSSYDGVDGIQRCAATWPG